MCSSAKVTQITLTRRLSVYLYAVSGSKSRYTSNFWWYWKLNTKRQLAKAHGKISRRLVVNPFMPTVPTFRYSWLRKRNGGQKWVKVGEVGEGGGLIAFKSISSVSCSCKCTHSLICDLMSSHLETYLRLQCCVFMCTQTQILNLSGFTTCSLRVVN